jgi:hypothetical protein
MFFTQKASLSLSLIEHGFCSTRALFPETSKTGNKKSENLRLETTNAARTGNKSIKHHESSRDSFKYTQKETVNAPAEGVKRDCGQ